jgi:hypothetical protein
MIPPPTQSLAARARPIAPRRTCWTVPLSSRRVGLSLPSFGVLAGSSLPYKRKSLPFLLDWLGTRADTVHLPGLRG